MQRRPREKAIAFQIGPALSGVAGHVVAAARTGERREKRGQQQQAVRDPMIITAAILQSVPPQSERR